MRFHFCSYSPVAIFVAPQKRPRHTPLLPAFVAAFALATLLALHLPQAAQAAENTRQWTPKQLFMQIPPSIFDNTPSSITEEEKELILECGYSTNWAVSHSDADTLFISTIKGDFADVAVHVFRNAGGGVVAIGARAQDNCAAELWSFDTSGRIVPLQNPEEPPVQDFLSPNVLLAPGITPTSKICLEGAQLEAKPSFWGKEGMVQVPVANRVFFRWNSTGFAKFVAPVSLPSEVPAGKR